MRRFDLTHSSQVGAVAPDPVDREEDLAEEDQIQSFPWPGNHHKAAYDRPDRKRSHQDGIDYRRPATQTHEAESKGRHDCGWNQYWLYVAATTEGYM